MRLHALLHPAQPPRRTRRLLAGGLLTALAVGGGGAALALADAAPKPVGPLGLHLTPEPEFLKRYVQADRSSGIREAVDVYSGGVELAGRAPAGYSVTVDGRPAAPEQDLAALGPVEAVQVRREATIPFGPKPRILQADIRLAQAGVPQPPAPPASSAPAVPPAPATQARNSVHSYTSTTTADEPGGATNVAVTILADRIEEQPGGDAVYTGRVQLQASGLPAGLILVDGRPQPAGFDVRSLNGRIQRVEARGQQGEGHPVFNVITR